MKKTRVAIFASGAGTNAGAIMHHFHHHPDVKIAIVLTNNSAAGVLARANEYGVPAKTFSRNELQSDVLSWLRENEITHIVLAGFLLLMPAAIIREFPERIINIHPSLLPKFSGKGMYGMNVHLAVQGAAETETGITIHLVNEKYDDGKILFQTACGIDKTDSVEQIAKKVHALEYEHFPKVIERWIKGGEAN